MKTSELIEALKRFQEAHGDLPVSIALAVKKSLIEASDSEFVVVSSDELHIGYDKYEDGDEIQIRDFPY